MTFVHTALNFIKRVVIYRITHVSRKDILVAAAAALLLMLIVLVFVDGLLFYSLTLKPREQITPTSKNSLLSEAEIMETTSLINKRRLKFEQIMRRSPPDDAPAATTTASTTNGQ